MIRVLLTDGDQRSTLAAVRALGRAGIEPIVGETHARSLAASSKYCRDVTTYPSPYDDERSFVDAIVAAAKRLRIDLVLPMTDITSAVLSEHKQDVERVARVAVVDNDTFWQASDKNALFTLADRVGVPTPVTMFVDGRIDEAQLNDVSFPCIVKPARSRVKTPAGWIKTSVSRAGSREELLSQMRTQPELQYPFTLQRIVGGEGVGIFALCNRGEVRILFAHARLREKPPWGGVSVLREATPVDPQAARHATTLLGALGWHGVAMVEFKRDLDTGVPQLMEINGRFWGSLQLAIDAGVNFPVHAVHLWLGQPVPVQTSYQEGVRSRWLLGDVDHVLARLTRRGPMPPGSPSVPVLLVDFCRFFRRDTRYEVESWRDPGPSLHEIAAYVADLFRAVTASRR